MATYLLDANCFIEAQNRFYSIDFCPGYWDWLKQQNKLGNLFSIDKIRAEVIKKEDNAANWAKQIGKGFFLPVDEDATEKLKDINIWAANAGYKEQLVRKFQNSNDQYLVAYGLAHGHTVVTHETLNANQRNAIKIPAACLGCKIHCMTIFEVLRATGAKLVLG